MLQGASYTMPPATKLRCPLHRKCGLEMFANPLNGR